MLSKESTIPLLNGSTKIDYHAAEGIFVKIEYHAAEGIFDSVYPEYTFKAVGIHYTFGDVGPMRANTRIRSYIHNL